MRDDYIHDIVFDPDDVDLNDLVQLSEGIHGVMCPIIVETIHIEIDDEIDWAAHFPWRIEG